MSPVWRIAIDGGKTGRAKKTLEPRLTSVGRISIVRDLRRPLATEAVAARGMGL
jgi:hypothetical protein